MTLEVGDAVRAVEGTDGALEVTGTVESFVDLGGEFDVLIRCSAAFYTDQVGELLAFNHDELERI